MPSKRNGTVHIAIDADPKTARKIKIIAMLNNISMKAYVLRCVEKQLEKINLDINFE